MADCRLTTTNNPWDPFTHFKEWYAFDLAHGYGCSEYLARVLKTSPHFSENDIEIMTENAIDEIVSYGIPLSDGAFYKKVKRIKETDQNLENSVAS